MAEPAAGGPEHVPLPQSGRPASRPAPAARERPQRKSAGTPALAVAAALLTVGASLIFTGARRSHPPALPAVPVAAIAPAAPPETIPAPPAATPRKNDPVESHLTPPLPSRADDAGAPVRSPAPPPPRALPEPPAAPAPAYMSDASSARAPEEQRLSPTTVHSLFNQRTGGFTPWTQHTVTRASAQTLPAVPDAPDPTTRPGECSDCAQAVNSSGRSVFSRTERAIGGTIVYVGPCKDGFVYRLTNLSAQDLPPYIVGEDGTVWKVGAIKPGQSAEIRSKTQLRRAQATNHL